MYTIIYAILLITSGFIAYQGYTKKKRGYLFSGLAMALLTVFFFWFMELWGEKLWFDQLGFPQRFRREWLSKILLIVAGAVIGAAYVFLFTRGLSRGKRWLRRTSLAAGIVVGGFFWYGQWETMLIFMNSVETGISEPILGMDIGFYLFELPFYKAVFQSLLYFAIIVLIVNVLAGMEMSEDNRNIEYKENEFSLSRGIRNISALLVIIAFGRFLHRYDLMYSGYGVVNGPGWTDDNIRLPMLLVTAILTLITAILILIPSFRRRMARIYYSGGPFSKLTPVFTSVAFLFGIWLILSGVLPWLFQWLKVEPNEITVEKPYIEYNIKYTRLGFDLEKVEEYEYPANEVFNEQVVEENRNVFQNIRLWDYRALDAVFKQFQEIRLYYEFHDVDIDRYILDDQYREVMVSAREMQTANLPSGSQTFVNKRFKYTHGYGSVLTKVNEFTPEGLPNLLIKDIPPVSEYPSLEIERPEVYYGELTNEYVIANSEEQEFDYPSGERNIYTSYKGEGGVPVKNLWRKFLYGWKFDGTKFLLSSYTTSESRIMMHRNIVDRARSLAPFLHFDDDPYIVISGGNMYWILDAYTTSQYMPYSESFSGSELIPYDRNNAERNLLNRANRYLRGRNYIRNSVKTVINAYNGEVDFYIFDEDDPVIKVYDAIFPGLFSTRDEMPDEIFSHVRYPADMLLVQGIVYAKYHMTDPTVFYNQEDLWVRATEKYYNNVQAVEPYYIMWEQPGSDEMEFVLMLPFTPKNKQVMIAWIAGMCDDENYGRFLAYKFPKEKRILGTQQVETKIDQDSYLSGQLTLWDQRGSNVIRGNVLAIPVSKTMIYVEPIYLQSETAAYPELRLVAIMHNDNLSYAPTFEEALQGLLTGEPPAATAGEEKPAGKENIDQLIIRANNAFNDYIRYTREEEFSKAGEALEELRRSLEEMGEGLGD